MNAEAAELRDRLARVEKERDHWQQQYKTMSAWSAEVEKERDQRYELGYENGASSEVASYQAWLEENCGFEDGITQAEAAAQIRRMRSSMDRAEKERDDYRNSLKAAVLQLSERNASMDRARDLAELRFAPGEGMIEARNRLARIARLLKGDE